VIRASMLAAPNRINALTARSRAREPPTAGDEGAENALLTQGVDILTRHGVGDMVSGKPF